jgi:hypothetical protein
MNAYQFDHEAGYNGNGMAQDGQQDLLGQQNMMMTGQGFLNGEADSGVAGGQSMDEIVNLNNMNNNLSSKLIRRQSMPQGYQNATQNQGNNYNNPSMRRMNSMLDFNGSRSPAEAMSTFSYPAGLNSNQGSMSGNNTPAQSSQVPLQSRRQSGNNDLNLGTNFSNAPQNYAAMLGANASYESSPAHQSGLDLDITSPFLDPSLGMQMDYSLDQNDMGNNMGSMGGNMGGTMGSNMGGNMGSNLGQNMGGNMGGNMSGNMGQDMGNGMGNNMGNHTSNGMNNNMSNNMGGNMNSNMAGNMANSMNNNMGGNVGRPMNANMGQNMGNSMSANMSGNMSNMGTNGNMTSNMSSGMDNMGSSTDDMQMSMYNQAQFNQNMTTSPMHPGTPQGRPVGPPRLASQHSGTGSTHGSKSQRPPLVHQLSRTQSSTSFTPSPQPAAGNTSSGETQQPQRPQQSRHQSTTNGGFQGQIQNPQPGSTQDRGMGRQGDGFDGVNGPLPLQPKQYNPNNQNFPWVPEGGSWPSTMVNKPHMQSAYKNAYSSTGFDMLGVLVCYEPLRRTDLKLTPYTDARCDPTKP